MFAREFYHKTKPRAFTVRGFVLCLQYVIMPVAKGHGRLATSPVGVKCRGRRP